MVTRAGTAAAAQQNGRRPSTGRPVAQPPRAAAAAKTTAKSPNTKEEKNAGGLSAKYPELATNFTNGVGGQCFFKLVPAKRSQATGQYGFDFDDQVLFEMAPARRSFADKQGQMVPGVGAGMDFSLRANIAKLNVPGARPLYQHMGIAEERIEFVGAFIGFDEYITDKGSPAWDNGEATGYNVNAWEKSQKLAYAVRQGKEMGLFLGWEESGDGGEVKNGGRGLVSLDHPLRFEKNAVFRGYVHSIVRTYATAQRVYYRISFIVTNTDDMKNSPTSYGGVVPLPGVIATFADYLGEPPAKKEPQEAGGAGQTEPATAAGQASGTVAPGDPQQPTKPGAEAVSNAAKEQARAALDKASKVSAKDIAKGVGSEVGLTPQVQAQALSLGYEIDKLALQAKNGVSEAELAKLNERAYVLYKVHIEPTGKHSPSFEKMMQKRDAVQGAVKAYNYEPVPAKGQAPAQAAAPARASAETFPVKPATKTAAVPPKAAATPPKVAAVPQPKAAAAPQGNTLNAPAVFGSELNTRLQSYSEYVNKWQQTVTQGTTIDNGQLTGLYGNILRDTSTAKSAIAAARNQGATGYSISVQESVRLQKAVADLEGRSRKLIDSQSALLVRLRRGNKAAGKAPKP